MTVENFLNYKPEDYYRRRGWLLGDGKCGGKAKGLAYAHTVLLDSDLKDKVELPFLSHIVSTEVFEDFLRSNGLEGLYDEEDWEQVQRRVAAASFSDAMKSDLDRILENFEHIGSPPLVVRSSSLMEDSVDLAFAGKYDSFFSANIRDLDWRVTKLEECLRAVWLSTFNPSARKYRTKHGKLHRDESMAVIVQSMIGKDRNNIYYPKLAGTIFSRIFRRPSPRIQKEDGLMCICFGIGTRAVDRGAARSFYLTNPALRPSGNSPERIAGSSQEFFDYIDRNAGDFKTGFIRDWLAVFADNHKDLDQYIEFYDEDSNMLLPYSFYSAMSGTRPLISFPNFHKRQVYLFSLAHDLIDLMESRLGLPVDMEFTYDTTSRDFRLVQLRPLTHFQEMSRVEIPTVPPEREIFRGDRMVSNGRLKHVPYLVYVEPLKYLNDWNPALAARAVGVLNDKLKGTRYILAGPGRWGSRNPAIGVPIQYGDIYNCGCLVELSAPQFNFNPELSYGSHFFLDMDSDNILYLPVFAGQSNNIYALDWLDNTDYDLGAHPAVRVYKGDFFVYLDGESERGLVYWDDE
ncbi:MAG: PEP/pyruvate-binding domain-containing protein [Synergistaceae bacterium]|nr:PEP/pyruvate-binding domain-containing protein [Synergistaceae bacterium]